MIDNLNMLDFWMGTNPNYLIEKYGSPLYVYNEKLLRLRCEEMRDFIPFDWFSVSYSTKANSNLSLLKIIKDCGLNADAMSPGEIYFLLKAGFEPSQILYIGNNVSEDEMKYAISHGVLVSVDSLSQLETYGKVNAGGRVSIRFNPGIGAGHHEKVVTAGNKTKFGIEAAMTREVQSIAKKYSLKIVGINQHIGSLFLNGNPYIQGVKALLDIASCFDDLEFIDFGGGFGIPYKKIQGEERLDLKGLSDTLQPILLEWMRQYGKKVKIKIEPGRYIVAESGVLLGTIHSVKQNCGTKYMGTDIGLNVIMRPVLYNSYHEVFIYREGKLLSNGETEKATIVGNICESGDILAKDRILPLAREGDIAAVLDAGAYGHVMCSNYNLRLRPAEVLITSDGGHRLIRKRDTVEDLMVNML